MAEGKAFNVRDDFVNRVVKDPNNPPNVQVLQGFLGNASQEGYVRVYFNLELSDYVDIPNDAILHEEPVPKETSPLGGHYIWIDKDREVIHGKVGEKRTKARFLEGRIQQAQMEQAAAAQQMAAQQMAAQQQQAQAQPAISRLICPVSQQPYICPTHNMSFSCLSPVCPQISRLQPCTIIDGCQQITHQAICTVTQQVSCLTICTVTQPVICTASPACQIQTLDCSLMCPQQTFPACPPVSLGCPQQSMACGPWNPGGGY